MPEKHSRPVDGGFVTDPEPDYIVRAHDYDR